MSSGDSYLAKSHFFNVNNSKLQDITEIANSIAAPLIIICCIGASFFLPNSSDRANILIGALGAGSAMWQHQSRRSDSTAISSSNDGKGTGTVEE
jgi:hypothetical protein